MGSMAMAEATSSPRLGSMSLTVLIVFFNVAQFAFSSLKTDGEPRGAQKEKKTFTDWKAVVSAIVNIVIGVFAVYLLQGNPAKTGLAMVGCQFLVQVFGVPLVSS